MSTGFIDDVSINISLFFFNTVQCLDGFLLAAFADGTIVYSTDNVLQYLGFNQVSFKIKYNFRISFYCFVLDNLKFNYFYLSVLY